MDIQPTHSLVDVQALRQDIETIAHRVETAFGRSRALALVKTKLDEARQWAEDEIDSLTPQGGMQEAQTESNAQGPVDGQSTPADPAPVEQPAPATQA